MKIPHSVLSLIAAAATSHAATTVTDLNHENIVAFLSPGGAGTNTASPRSQNFIFTDGVNSVTLSLSATTQSGDAFRDLDPGSVHVGVVGGTSQAHWESTENITFTVGYVSSTANVDTSTIAFQFNSIGIRNFIDFSTTDSFTWNGGSNINFIGASSSTTDYELDTGFTTIGTTVGVYSRVLHNNDNFGQLSNDSASPSDGLNISARFDVVPEPSAALLGGLGLLALLRRRR